MLLRLLHLNIVSGHCFEFNTQLGILSLSRSRSRARAVHHKFSIIKMNTMSKELNVKWPVYLSVLTAKAMNHKYEEDNRISE